MRIRWHGQSAFALTGESASVFVDPFGDMSARLAERGLKFDYPAIEGASAELLLITHEHADHNHVDAVGGGPAVIRSTAGRLDSPIGEVVAIASEHDEQAGTQRGPNTIFVFELDGLRIAHFGDFGQRELRDAQLHAIGSVDLVFMPVGGMATIDGAGAASITTQLGPRWVVPMHYRTHRISFLEPADAFLEHFDSIHRLEDSEFDPADSSSGGGPAVVLPAAP